MLLLNAAMLAAYVRSMHRLGTVRATVTNTGANFMATVRHVHV